MSCTAPPHPPPSNSQNPHEPSLPAHYNTIGRRKILVLTRDPLESIFKRMLVCPTRRRGSLPCQHRTSNACQRQNDTSSEKALDKMVSNADQPPSRDGQTQPRWGVYCCFQTSMIHTKHRDRKTLFMCVIAAATLEKIIIMFGCVNRQRRQQATAVAVGVHCCHQNQNTPHHDRKTRESIRGGSVVSHAIYGAPRYTGHPSSCTYEYAHRKSNYLVLGIHPLPYAQPTTNTTNYRNLSRKPVFPTLPFLLFREKLLPLCVVHRYPCAPPVGIRRLQLKGIEPLRPVPRSGRQLRAIFFENQTKYKKKQKNSRTKQ